MASQENDIGVGTIVQITDPQHHWYGALIVISETKSFGCQGYAPVPHNDGTGTAQAYIRLSSDAYEAVGMAVLVSA